MELWRILPRVGINGTLPGAPPATQMRQARNRTPNAPALPALATIGVYGFTAESFLAALQRADVRLLIDVRQRRGVRGPEYAWANSARLQGALAEAGIEYRHHKELAPTTELRRLQYREDDRLGVGKRSRAELAPEYRRRYIARSSTRWTSRRSWRSFRATPPRRSCAWSATRRPATARSWRSASSVSTACRWRTSAPIRGRFTPRYRRPEESVRTTLRQHLWTAALAAALACAPVAAAQAPDAPGSPGQPHTWASADKHGFGSARSQASNVAFTLRSRELTEIY